MGGFFLTAVVKKLKAVIAISVGKSDEIASNLSLCITYEFMKQMCSKVFFIHKFAKPLGLFFLQYDV